MPWEDWHFTFTKGFRWPDPGPDPKFPVLRKGSGGPQKWAVKKLQRKLNKHGFQVKADGNFGKTTKNRVRRFQRAFGLKDDGIVGKKTWQALNKPAALRRGMKGPRVRAFTRQLAALWHPKQQRYFLDGKAVNQFNARVEREVKEFQRVFGLKADGIAGQATTKAMQKVAERQRSWIKDLKKRADALRAQAKKKGWTQKAWDEYRDVLTRLHRRGVRKKPAPARKKPPKQEKKPAQPKKKALVEKMRAAGIVNPNTTFEEAKRAGLDLALACALLEQESYKGKNIYGHDPVANPAPKGGKVTRENYLNVYLPARKAGLGMQGVGPCQLTWYEFQDRADRLGGCWRPRYNMRVGFEHLAALIKAHGEAAGLARYNGSGPAAEAYSRSVRAKRDEWRKRLT